MKFLDFCLHNTCSVYNGKSARKFKKLLEVDTGHGQADKNQNYKKYYRKRLKGLEAVGSGIIFLMAWAWGELRKFLTFELLSRSEKLVKKVSSNIEKNSRQIKRCQKSSVSISSNSEKISRQMKRRQKKRVSCQFLSTLSVFQQ